MPPSTSDALPPTAAWHHSSTDPPQLEWDCEARVDSLFDADPGEVADDEQMQRPGTPENEDLESIQQQMDNEAKRLHSMSERLCS